MKKNLKIFILFSFISTIIFSQEGKIILKKNDFEYESTYYNGHLIMKTKIYDLIKNIKNNKLKLNDFLLKRCFPLSVEGKLTEKDSISEINKALNSLGNTIFCISKIDNKGNINYYITHSRNLNIVIGEGIIKR